MLSFENLYEFAKSTVKLFFSLKITGVTFFVALGFLVLAYYIVPLKKRWIVFTVANLLFVYGVAGSKLPLFCMITMMIATWLFSLSLEKKEEERACKNCKLRKAIFVIAILFDIGILLLLKDINFFTRILHIEISDGTLETLHKFSPVGISYWTLVLVAYLVDVYKGKILPQKNFSKFLACTIFFPTLVSGPILRLERDANEILEGHKFDYEKFCFGVQRVVWGVFKKIVVADRAAIFVATVFDTNKGADYQGFYIWLAAAMYFVQLFADFSGCIDIALGSAELFGIKLPQNFDLPFLSKSIAEFWRRWHITLGGWFRDYIYIPLGGNRKGKLRKYFNIMVVFLVSGLWHGGTVRFLAWGILHGAYQVIGELTLPLRKKFCEKAGINRECFSFKLWQCAVVFVLSLVAWVFFRAYSFNSALVMLKNVVKLNPWIFFDGSLFKLGLDVAEFRVLNISILTLVVLGIVKHKIGKDVRVLVAEQNVVFRWLVWIVLVISILVFGQWGPDYNAQSFIYYQF